MNYSKDNVFYKIISGEISCSFIYEDENVIAFNDIKPIAPVHILVIPRNLYTSFDDFAKNSPSGEIGDFFKTVRKIANENCGKSYKIQMNCGEKAGQTVFHFHVHIIGDSI